MTAYHIYLITPGQETLVQEIYLSENAKLSKGEIPSKMDKKTANDLASRLNLAKIRNKLRTEYRFDTLSFCMKKPEGSFIAFR